MGITVLAAIAILAVIGLAYRFVINPRAAIAPAEADRGEVAAQGWPSPPPTFTAGPSPTPVLTATPLPSPTRTPTPSPTPTPTPLPPPYWEELGYLTSIEFTSTAIVEKEREKSGVRSVLGADRVLLMAVGEVQAGVDLSQVRSSDFEIDGSRLTLILPGASVTSVELLPGESRIYDSKHSWAFSEYEGLEKEALEEARQQLRETVESSDSMMSLAETLARLQLSDFLRKAGFTEIDIVFRGERN
jgi:hypothetical protein